MSLENCWAADFETTTDPSDCRVWAFSLCNIENYNEFYYGTSIDEFFEFIELRNAHNYKMWFHNLKFDSSYILTHLFLSGYKWIPSPKEKADKTFTTLITDMGQYYSLTVYFSVKGNKIHKVTFYDSLKIFNFSVENVAKGFNLPISKLKIDYDKYRPVGYNLDESEIAYIRNDVEIMARALKIMFEQGHTRMTIASDAMHNFQENFVGFRKKFPKLTPEVDAEIRASYRGGFTYVNSKHQGKLLGKGITIDVNSLYPSILRYSPMPYSQPLFFEGKYQHDPYYPLYVQTLSCSFEIKPNKIPSIQLKNNLSFIPNEYVKSSKGKEVSLCLTTPDLELFFKQYNVYNPIYNGGWKFKAAKGFFNNYVDHWMQQKIKAGKEGNAPLKLISKALLNSLYGRYGISGNARQKIPFLNSEGILKFVDGEPEQRETCYIPVACFVTAFGRYKTITTSQAITDFTLKKYGEDRYYYSDTDSIHANLSDEDLDELKDIIHVDDFKLGYWAKEAEFTKAMYIRQKCYMEEVDGKNVVKVCGLPKYLGPILNFNNFKKGFSTGGLSIPDLIKMAKANGATDEELEAIHHKKTYKYVRGGVILADTDFTIK